MIQFFFSSKLDQACLIFEKNHNFIEILFKL